MSDRELSATSFDRLSFADIFEQRIMTAHKPVITDKGVFARLYLYWWRKERIRESGGNKIHQYNVLIVLTLLFANIVIACFYDGKIHQDLCIFIYKLMKFLTCLHKEE